MLDQLKLKLQDNYLNLNIEHAMVMYWMLCCLLEAVVQWDGLLTPTMYILFLSSRLIHEVFMFIFSLFWRWVRYNQRSSISLGIFCSMQFFLCPCKKKNSFSDSCHISFHMFNGTKTPT